MLHTHQRRITLLFCAGGAHCVRLPSARLAICEDRDIVALDERAHALVQVAPYAFLIYVFAKHPVEDEELLALGGFDS